MSTHEEDVLGKAYDSRLMRRLLGYLRPYRRQVALAVAAIIGHSTLQLAPPYFTKVAIDRYIPAGDLAGLGMVAALYLVAQIAFLLAIAFFVYLVWRDRVNEKAGKPVTVEV